MISRFGHVKSMCRNTEKSSVFDTNLHKFEHIKTGYAGGNCITLRTKDIKSSTQQTNSLQIPTIDFVIKGDVKPSPKCKDFEF